RRSLWPLKFPVHTSKTEQHGLRTPHGGEFPMRNLSLSVVVFASLLFVPSLAHAANVTVSGTTTFASLDGSADDEDHAVNGVFTVSGDLTVNGSINCNDTGGSSSACAMSFSVGRDFIVNAGGALYAENR